MPSISATPIEAVPAVRVMVNWSDAPGAVNASVYRIDCETGEETQLRPYVAYNGDGYILLSCGQAVFWDTEFPFDRCVRYCTRAQTALGTEYTTPPPTPFLYTFSTPVVNGWGPADTGQPFTLFGGTNPGDYDVAAGVGTQSNGVVNDQHRAWADAGLANIGTTLDHMLLIGSAVGANASSFHVARFIDINNYYFALIVLTVSGTIDLFIGKRQAGSLIILAGGVTVGTGHAGGDWWTTRLEVWGNLLRAKAWLRTTVEPDTWGLSLIDPSPFLTGTNLGAISRLETGNGNALPVIFSYDNLTAYDPCAVPVVVESCTADLMVSSSGYSMLRDPMRPCNDIRVEQCWPQDPNCVPGRGVFFSRLEAEGYGANSLVSQAFNSPRAASASRERSDAASTLVTITRSFEDRDAMLEINKAGTPLLWQSPPEYGIPDRYIQVQDMGVARYHPDHRYQPRVVTLPFLTEDRPEGPSQGLCGTRVDDLCDTYATWDAMIAAGLTYLDLLLGEASPNGPVDPNGRRWIDVETGFANWLAVETAPNTWQTLRDGS